MAPLVRRTWAPRGVTPVFYQPTRSHRKVSVIAALTLPPRYRRVGLYFSLHTDANVTAHKVVLFLRRLTRQIQKQLLIVWDRLNTHRAVTVNRWLARHPNVHIEYLPPYAPELNPVEHLWGYLKGNPLANWAAERDLRTITHDTLSCRTPARPGQTTAVFSLCHPAFFTPSIGHCLCRYQ